MQLSDSSSLTASGAARRIAIIGSGTAGHVSPALAIADAYQKACTNVEVLFLGNTRCFEARLLPTLGRRLALIQGAPLFGVGMVGKLRAMQCLAVGICQARRILRTYGAQLVISLGGYTSASVVLAARSLGLPTVIHEANIVPGLTNRLLGRFVQRVYLGFAAAGWAFAPQHTRVTGNPIRPEIAKLNLSPRSAPAPEKCPAHILVTGGSQGSHFLNQQAPAFLRTIAAQGIALEVWHQTGEEDCQPIQTAYSRIGVPGRVTSYIPDMAEAYQWADFAVTCAGALTLSELAVVGLPALFVPLAVTAGDHQTQNALAMTEAGAGWWVSEAQWCTDDLARRLATLLNDAKAWQDASQGMRRLAILDAAQTVVADCEALLAA
jgi:UDP-N-acetylglucosamine--N-acetylmuramyl-(pentapeptide) pyrophosphoryl-undecaprenol N-acetylglucosamine transferase